MGEHPQAERAPAQPNGMSESRDTMDSTSQLNAYITDLHETVLARDKTVSELHRLLGRRNACLAERTARVQELERLVSSSEKELEALTKRFHRLTEEEKKVRRRNDRLQAELHSVYSSSSWRITRVLRTLSRVCGARWIIRNTRRTVRLIGWLATGQIGRASMGLRSYYRRCVPTSVKKLVPASVRKLVRSRVLTVPNGARPDTSTAGRKAQRPTVAHDDKYLHWIAQNDTLSDHDLTLIRRHIAALPKKPKFSVLVPVNSVELPQLREAIDSVLGQLYGEWELCLAYSTSLERAAQSTLEQYARKDHRVRLQPVRTHGVSHFLRRPCASVSGCADTALEMASGDWTVLMDPHDIVAAHAFYLIAEAINREPEARIIYSDEDKIDARGRRFDPHFKPDWDYDLFLGQNVLGRLIAYRADLARSVGGFRKEAGGVYDWDFGLRAVERVVDTQIIHLPFILCHRRQTEGASLPGSLARARAAAQRSVNEHLRRTRQAAVAVPTGHSTHLRIKRELPREKPLVSIIIPTKDHCSLLRTCIDGLLDRTDYAPLEIIVVDNGSTERDALAYLEELRAQKGVRVVVVPGVFNFSRLVNRGVVSSSGEVLVFLNNDVEVIHSDWLSEMVSHAIRSEVGAVGAKLYYPDDTIQHGGVILGIHHGRGAVAAHAHRLAQRGSPGYSSRLILMNRQSAVTAACLATRREVYNVVGGFDEQNLGVSFNDVDFCLRVRQAGYSILWTPNAELYHHESASRGNPLETRETADRNQRERAYMRRSWGQLLDADPYYNANLSLRSTSFSVAGTSRVRKPWLEFAATQWERPPEALDVATLRALWMAAQKRMEASIMRRVADTAGYKERIALYKRAHTADHLPSSGDMRIAIYTAVAQGYDAPKVPEYLDPRFTYLFFTDGPAPDTEVYQLRPIPYLHWEPTRTARYVKTHPHTMLDEYHIAIWVDASIMILGDIYPLVEDFLASGRPVAAVPHPQRSSIYEELNACIEFGTDDEEVMHEQLAEYRSEGFDHDDLIESNLMMFDLRVPRVKSFLNAWWAQIDRYSKRDQLSVNYALARAGIDWHWLTERPNSVRNHPAFAYVRHDGGKGVAKELVEALEAPSVDPYAGSPYTSIRDERIAAWRNHTIDVVLCVHNALDDVERCLDSICRNRTSDRQRLLIIDDGSSERTASFLREFTARTPWAELHHNAQAEGYTRAANRGLAASSGELVILLNSDTIVTDGWAEKLADAVFTTPGAGIVGPLSNAASYQSIPNYRSSETQTAINQLPPRMTPDDMNRFCEQWTASHILPLVPLVHGFCLGVSREVIDTIGFLDEQTFPRGYGEESDYCFRAADAGFGLVIATHTFIFHAKSKSYVSAERVALTRAGSQALEQHYGRSRIRRAVRTMEENPMLVRLRERAETLYPTPACEGEQEGEDPDVPTPQQTSVHRTQHNLPED